MNTFFNNHFYYSQRDKKGILALTTLIGLALLLLWWPYAPIQQPVTLPPEAIAFMETLAVKDQIQSFSPHKATLGFYFDPNTADSLSLLRLGFSPKNIRTLVNYRNKGGQFNKPEDLAKIYGLSKDLIAAVLPFVQLQNSPSIPSDSPWKAPHQTAFNETIHLQVFDPNTASEAVLKGLGLHPKTVNAMLNFREKKGRFFKKEDIKKIYNFSDLDYLRLESYIQITDNEQFTKKIKNKDIQMPLGENANRPYPVRIDINKATLDEWLQLNGIGRTFATRIIENREKLGGFYSPEQIRETYGLPDSTFRAIVPFLTHSEVTRKLYINRASMEELTHPYWSRKQITAILRYRVNHGPFNGLSDLKSAGVLDEGTLQRLASYLSFEK